MSMLREYLCICCVNTFDTFEIQTSEDSVQSLVQLLHGKCPHCLGGWLGLEDARLLGAWIAQTTRTLSADSLVFNIWVADCNKLLIALDLSSFCVTCGA